MKQHPLDAVSLVCGVIFAGIGALYLSGYEVGDMVTRFWPAGVILLGLAMLFSARRPEEVAIVPPARPVEQPVKTTEVTVPIEPAE